MTPEGRGGKAGPGGPRRPIGKKERGGAIKRLGQREASRQAALWLAAGQSSRALRPRPVPVVDPCPPARPPARGAEPTAGGEGGQRCPGGAGPLPLGRQGDR